MTDEDAEPDDGSEADITLTAEGANIYAKEKVQTQQYENAEVSLSIDVGVEGVDITDGMPKKLRQYLYGLKRQVQAQVRDAAKERKAEADEPPEARQHEV